jgi:hypothetical protein
MGQSDQNDQDDGGLHHVESVEVTRVNDSILFGFDEDAISTFNVWYFGKIAKR